MKIQFRTGVSILCIDSKRSVGLFCVLLGLFTTVQAVEPRSATATPEQEREAKIYQTIEKIISRRDRLLPKFAVVLRGESVGTSPDRGFSEYLVTHIRVTDRKKNFDLRSGIYILDHRQEIGDELVQIGGTWKGRKEGGLLVNAYETKPKDTSVGAWKNKFANAWGYDPFDDELHGVTVFRRPCDGKGIEQSLVGSAKYIRSEIGLGDRLTGHWELVFDDGAILDWTIEFDPAVEMMPIHVNFVTRGTPQDYQDTRIEWKRHGKWLLPWRVELSEGDIMLKNVSTETTLVYHWLIGDEVPDEIFKSEDHLAALMDHLKLPHSVKVGHEVVSPYQETPEGLYDGLKGKK